MRRRLRMVANTPHDSLMDVETVAAPRTRGDPFRILQRNASEGCDMSACGPSILYALSSDTILPDPSICCTSKCLGANLFCYTSRSTTTVLSSNYRCRARIGRVA